MMNNPELEALYNEIKDKLFAHLNPEHFQSTPAEQLLLEHDEIEKLVRQHDALLRSLQKINN